MNTTTLEFIVMVPEDKQVPSVPSTLDTVVSPAQRVDQPPDGEIDFDIGLAHPSDIEVPEASPPPTSPSPSTVILLDPRAIRRSAMPNREIGSYLHAEADGLAASIKRFGYNVSPIGVSVSYDEQGNPIYELVYGERRLRGCEAAGVLVRAVIVPAVTEVDKALERVAENAARLDLEPIELGRQVKHLLSLNKSLGLNQKLLASMLGYDAGTISKALQLANLPEEVLAAFAAPEELQYDHRTPLRKALEANQDAVIAEALRLAKEGPREPIADVIERLVSASNGGMPPKKQGKKDPDKDKSTEAPSTAIRVGEREVGHWSIDDDGTMNMRLSRELLPEQRDEVTKLVAKFFNANVYRPKSVKKKSEDKQAAGASSASEVAPCNSTASEAVAPCNSAGEAE